MEGDAVCACPAPSYLWLGMEVPSCPPLPILLLLPPVPFPFPFPSSFFSPFSFPDFLPFSLLHFPFSLPLLPFSFPFSSPFSLPSPVGARHHAADDPRRGMLSTHKHDVYWLWDGSGRDLETPSLAAQLRDHPASKLSSLLTPAFSSGHASKPLDPKINHFLL